LRGGKGSELKNIPERRNEPELKKSSEGYKIGAEEDSGSERSRRRFRSGAEPKKVPERSGAPGVGKFVRQRKGKWEGRVSKRKE